MLKAKPTSVDRTADETDSVWISDWYELAKSSKDDVSDYLLKKQQPNEKYKLTDVSMQMQSVGYYKSGN